MAKDPDTRDFIAAVALHGLLVFPGGDMSAEDYAKTAYKIADAMMKEKEGHDEKV